MTEKAYHSSKKMTWRTPESVLLPVRKVLEGEILLDPAASADPNHWIAKRNITESENGLTQSWSDKAFVNPPYGRVLPKWAKKIAAEAANGYEILALVPARTDTRWFRVFWDTANGICFYHRRIVFVGASSGAPFPSAVVYWGKRKDVFDSVFRAMGPVVTGWSLEEARG